MDNLMTLALEAHSDEHNHHRRYEMSSVVTYLLTRKSSIESDLRIGLYRRISDALPKCAGDLFGKFQVAFGVDLGDVGRGVAEDDLCSFNAELLADLGGGGMAKLIG